MAGDAKKPEPSKKGSEAARKGAEPAKARTDAAQRTVLECPRCRMSMAPAKYETVSVEFCDTCWGYWIGLHQLETILTSKDEVFSRAEQERAGKSPAHPADGKPIVCVRCGKGMAKIQVKDGSGAPAFFLDICKEHGVWLDTGEIKQAQILDEKTGNVRRALHAALGRAASADDES